MGKVRIYALAKELGLTNDEMLRELHRMGLQADSALSSIDGEVAEKLRGDSGRSAVKVTKVEEKQVKKKAARKKTADKAKPKAKAKTKTKAKAKAKAKAKVAKKAAASTVAATPEPPEEPQAAPEASQENPSQTIRARVRRVRRGPPPGSEIAPQVSAEAADAPMDAAPPAEETAVDTLPPASDEALRSPLADALAQAVAESAEDTVQQEAPTVEETEVVAETVPEAATDLHEPDPEPVEGAPAELAEIDTGATDQEEPTLKLRKKDPAILQEKRRLVRRTTPPSAPGVKRVKKVHKVISTGKLPPKTEETKGKRRRKQEPAEVVEEVRITEGMTVKDLADKLQRKAKDVQAKLLEMGLMVPINQALDTETATKVVEGMGATAEIVSFEEDLVLEEVEEEKDVELVDRPSVVVVMGHVDHGKTSVLDAIREANVVTREAGGITQHIGAYRVKKDGKYIAFLDTPGHEAFTLMRLRGADATDIVVLVVAADDGIMPQTLESINHARAAEKPIIVAINKCDKPEADPERVMRQLGEQDLLPEDWGGDTITIKCSAHTKEGLDSLLEMILLQAELLELKAAPDRAAMGAVLEARLDRARGAVATILVQDGTLRVGDFLLAGAVLGKVRAMFDEHGRPVKEAGPSTPVEVLGLNEVPEAGDQFQVVPDEARARKLAEFRQEKLRKQQMGASARMTLDQLYQKIQEEGTKELKLILKADVQGSVEVLKKSLLDLSTDSVRVNVIHAASGPISESDVLLASTSGAIIVGFNVRPEKNARVLADKEGIDIRLHTVIYHVTEEIEKAMVGLLEPEEKEVELGRAEVRETFKVPKLGIIAGCHVSEGKIERNGLARLLRDNIVIWEGKLASLRRFKDDVGEVRSGFECGIGLEAYQDIKPGDEIEVYRIDKVQVQTLR